MWIIPQKLIDKVCYTLSLANLVIAYKIDILVPAELKVRSKGDKLLIKVL